MLVLSRRIGQQIRIGKSIVVTLLKVDRNKARIGVEAPLGVPVFRQELLDFDKPNPVGSRTASHSSCCTDREINPVDHQGVTRPRFLWSEAAV